MVENDTLEALHRRAFHLGEAVSFAYTEWYHRKSEENRQHMEWMQGKLAAVRAEIRERELEHD